MLLGGGHDEYGVGRGLFERLEESVEGALGEHVHLVDDVYAVASELRGYAYHLDELANAVDGVVGGGIELVYVVGAAGVE